jgi:hypothetical protein
MAIFAPSGARAACNPPDCIEIASRTAANCNPPNSVNLQDQRLSFGGVHPVGKIDSVFDPELRPRPSVWVSLEDARRRR